MKLGVGTISVVACLGVIFCATIAAYEAVRYDTVARGAELADSLTPDPEPISKLSAQYVLALKEAGVVLSELRMRHQSNLILHSTLLKVLEDAKQSARNSAALWVFVSALFAAILLVSEKLRRTMSI